MYKLRFIASQKKEKYFWRKETYLQEKKEYLQEKKEYLLKEESVPLRKKYFFCKIFFFFQAREGIIRWGEERIPMPILTSVG